jgi:hypothetical protein
MAQIFRHVLKADKKRRIHRCIQESPTQTKFRGKYSRRDAKDTHTHRHKQTCALTTSGVDAENIDPSIRIAFFTKVCPFRSQTAMRVGLSPDFVVAVVATSEDEALPTFAAEAHALGFGDLGVVMNAADRNLGVI